MIPQIFGSKNV